MVSKQQGSREDLHFKTLQLIEAKPDITQRELADQLGISLGKTNYVLKALKDKGLVKLSNFSRNPNKLQYVHLLTPQGLSEKTQLTLRFLKRKVQEYEQLKAEIDELKHTLESEKSE